MKKNSPRPMNIHSLTIYAWANKNKAKASRTQRIVCQFVKSNAFIFIALKGILN
jgi:hypothetical protein